ncbi:restriction endonuclease subunit S [Pantoea agglomerans]|jgi:type I restriction enzyme S subunit|uniref:restriction endonuclease subunit S n=1 Tax=Enterobacter agglomerans TaxID=549 RepID=UPI0021D79A48|nr:restriction endonuclease subunit S [Pantoea agglomerans]WNK51482.1 restriction endonuclease subunit S [Pantoea agglomerans]
MNLPDTWAEARLGDVLSRVDTKVDPQTSQTNSHFYIGLEHIESHTGRLLRDAEEVTESRDILSIKTAFNAGDILYGKLRPNLSKVHLATQEGICSTDIWALRTAECLLPDFALRYLRSPAIYVRAAQLATGANLPRLSADAFDRLPIPLPTLPEQQRIVDVLEQAETFGHSRLATQETLATVLREQYTALFGDVLLNDKSWPVRKISQVSELVRGSSPRPQGDPRLFGGPVPRLMVSDVTRDGLWVNATTDSLTEEGAKSSRPMAAQSVVMAVSGAPGLTAILNHDACIHDGFVGLRDLSADLLPEFVAFTLNLLRAKNDQQAVGAVFRNLTTDQVKAMVIPVPPMEKQEAFREILSQWQVIQRDIAKSKRLIDELMNELTIDAYSGKLTEAWRVKSASQLAEAAAARGQILHERGTKIALNGKDKLSLTVQTDLTVRPARHWLIPELSQFQRQVLAVFSEFCQQSGQPLLAEDPDVFSRFCDDSIVSDRLQAFGQFQGNRIRRSLSQLAGLGLIAKITLLKQDSDSGEHNYLKAFRPLRPEEFTRMVDVQALRKTSLAGVDQQRYYFEVQLDYESSEHAGAGGMFQVITVVNEDNEDFIHLVDQGQHYTSLDALREGIARSLKVEAWQVDLEAV